MIIKPTHTRLISTTIIMAFFFVSSLSAVIDTAAVTKSSTISTPSPFTQPTFNFDFGGLTDRKSAQDAMAQTRSNWGNFFLEKPKPVFSE